MNNLHALNRRYETVAWGAIVSLLGILMLIPGDQNNIFVLGIGAILLGLNLLRSARLIPVNWFTSILGTLALVLGGLSLLWPVMGLKTHFQVDIFPILVLVTGLYLLIPGPKKEIAG